MLSCVQSGEITLVFNSKALILQIIQMTLNKTFCFWTRETLISIGWEGKRIGS